MINPLVNIENHNNQKCNGYFINDSFIHLHYCISKQIYLCNCQIKKKRWVDGWMYRVIHKGWPPSDKFVK